MKLPKNILDIIKASKTSLGDNPALPPELDEKFLVFLVNDYYEDLLKHFDSIDVKELSDDLSRTITECKKIEKDNQDALEKLCFDLVNDLFQIPSDTIKMEMRLVDKIDAKKERLVPETTDYSFENISDMNNLTNEIYKRRLLNAIIIGVAMYYTENVNSYEKSLNKIDYRLSFLYKKIMRINNLLLFHTKQKLSKKIDSGGCVDVYLGSETAPVKIQSQGVIFPILLEESIRGLLELSIAHGLPNERAKTEYITSKADFKLAEIWDQRLGIPLWERIKNVFEEVNENPLDVGLNFIMMEISMFKPSKFNPIMQEILAGTNTGKKLIEKLSEKIYYEKEQDDFIDYIQTKQNDDTYQLNDDEFTSDDLINDDLCASTTLDEEDD